MEGTSRSKRGSREQRSLSNSYLYREGANGSKVGNYHSPWMNGGSSSIQEFPEWMEAGGGSCQVCPEWSGMPSSHASLLGNTSDLDPESMKEWDPSVTEVGDSDFEDFVSQMSEAIDISSRKLEQLEQERLLLTGYAETAMEYYNQIQGGDFEFVELVRGSTGSGDGTYFHIHFLAKPKNLPCHPSYLSPFFAEVFVGFTGEPSVKACTLGKPPVGSGDYVDVKTNTTVCGHCHHDCAFHWDGDDVGSWA